MTDQFGPTDRVADTLTALRTDTDRLGLADSGAVRRRGEQRTRNQVVGTALAVAALVAGTFGVASSLTGSDQSIQGPPGKGTATAEATEPTVETPVELAAQPLLDAADLPTFAGATGWQVSPDEAAADQPFLQCLPSPSELGATQTEKRFFYTELAPTATEHVLRFPTAAAAESVLASFRGDLEACGQQLASGASLDQRPVEDTSAGFRYSQSSAPAGSEVSYVEVDAARRSNVVVVLQWNGAVDEVSSDQGTWVWDEPALSRALDRAIG